MGNKLDKEGSLNFAAEAKTARDYGAIVEFQSQFPRDITKPSMMEMWDEEKYPVTKILQNGRVFEPKPGRMFKSIDGIRVVEILPDGRIIEPTADSINGVPILTEEELLLLRENDSTLAEQAIISESLQNNDMLDFDREISEFTDYYSAVNEDIDIDNEYYSAVEDNEDIDMSNEDIDMNKEISEFTEYYSMIYKDRMDIDDDEDIYSVPEPRSSNLKRKR
jgi:hypothetical protein